MTTQERQVQTLQNEVDKLWTKVAELVERLDRIDPDGQQPERERTDSAGFF